MWKSNSEKLEVEYLSSTLRKYRRRGQITEAEYRHYLMMISADEEMRNLCKIIINDKRSKKRRLSLCR